jgi:hypothetical protein
MDADDSAPGRPGPAGTDPTGPTPAPADPPVTVAGGPEDASDQSPTGPREAGRTERDVDSGLGTPEGIVPPGTAPPPVYRDQRDAERDGAEV